MTSQIACIATFVAKEGQAEMLQTALRALVSPSQSEEGCVSYALYNGIKNPNQFTMIESYKDRAAYDFHSKQPYLLNLIDRLGDLAESVSITLYKPDKDLPA